MRVISGIYRGRRLKEPADNSVRPTTDKVKESVFNIIQFDIEGRNVLDLFAGTGQLGIECLSRGARSVTFVDKSRESLSLVKENLRLCGAEGRVVCFDSTDFLKSCKTKYDLILLDPPYATDLLNKSLEIINSVDILSESGIIICESMREKALLEMKMPYYLRKEYFYGKIKLSVFSREADV